MLSATLPRTSLQIALKAKKDRQCQLHGSYNATSSTVTPAANYASTVTSSELNDDLDPWHVLIRHLAAQVPITGTRRKRWRNLIHDRQRVSRNRVRLVNERFLNCLQTPSQVSCNSPALSRTLVLTNIRGRIEKC